MMLDPRHPFWRNRDPGDEEPDDYDLAGLAAVERYAKALTSVPHIHLSRLDGFTESESLALTLRRGPLLAHAIETEWVRGD